NARIEPFRYVADHGKGSCLYALEVLRVGAGVVFGHYLRCRTDRIKISVLVNIVQRPQAKFISRRMKGIVSHRLEINVKIVGQVRCRQGIGKSGSRHQQTSEEQYPYPAHGVYSTRPKSQGNLALATYGTALMGSRGAAECEFC